MVGACVVGVAMLGVILWGFNKGWDPNVEGFYMLAFQHPEIYPTFTSFHLLLAKLPHLVPSEILHYRLMEVVFRLVPAVVLSYASLKYIENKTKNLHCNSYKHVFLAAFACIGALQTFSIFPRTISYNGLTAAAVFMSVALALLSASGGSSILLVGCGLALAVTFFSKFTSAAILVVLLSAFIASERGARAPLPILAGFACGVAAYFCFVESPHSWWTSLSESVAIEFAACHNSNSITSGFVDLVNDQILTISAFVCAVIANHVFKAKDVDGRRMRFNVAALCSVPVLVGILKTKLYSLPTAALAILALVGAPLLRISKETIRTPWAKLACLLLLGPLVASFGTNCSLIGHMGSNLAPWYVLIGMLLINAVEWLGAASAYPAVIVAGALCAVTLYKFIPHYINDSGDAPPLLWQTTHVDNVPLLRGIRVEPEQALYYETIRKMLFANGFKTGDSILCLYDMPGLNYIMDAVSPGQAFYIGWKKSDEENAFYIKECKQECKQQPEKNFFLALRGKRANHIIRPKAAEALKSIGMPFPEAFDAVGTLDDPFNSKKTFLYKLKPSNSSQPTSASAQ